MASVHKSGGPKAKESSGIERAKEKRGEWGYLILWEFQLRAGMERRFEEVYGPDGEWVRVFEQDESYIRTELIRNLKGARTYVTLDFWTSQEAYDEFRKQHLAKYKALDQKCEDLTESEREIGRFVRVPNK